MEQTADIRVLNEKIEKESAFVDMIRLEMNKVIVGQRHLTDSLLIGLLANGHILLEGVPGGQEVTCGGVGSTSARRCAAGPIAFGGTSA